MRRKGFTIVELMMVVGIIAVLLTLVVSSVSGALKKARQQRASSLCKLVEQGFSTWRAQNPDGKWPFTVRDGETDDYELNSSEVKQAIFTLVKEVHDGNPVMDVSGLFVCTHDGARGTKYHGMDFMVAVFGSKQHPQRRKASELYYGYPEESTGYFRNFKVVYSPTTDRVKVSQQ